MGRARLLTSIIGDNGALTRITNLETGLADTNLALAALTTLVGGIVNDVASLDNRLDVAEAKLATLAQFAKVFTSPAEQYASLPVNGSHVAVYSLYVPDMLPNDIMMLFGQFEVTNDLGYTCGVSRTLLRAANAVATTGTPLLPGVAAMDNVDPTRHHMVLTAAGAEVNPNTNGVYYNMTAAAVSTSGSGNLTIEAGYGRLVGVRLRNPT